MPLLPAMKNPGFNKDLLVIKLACKLYVIIFGIKNLVHDDNFKTTDFYAWRC